MKPFYFRKFPCDVDELLNLDLTALASYIARILPVPVTAKQQQPFKSVSEFEYPLQPALRKLRIYQRVTAKPKQRKAVYFIIAIRTKRSSSGCPRGSTTALAGCYSR